MLCTSKVLDGKKEGEGERDARRGADCEEGKETTERTDEAEAEQTRAANTNKTDQTRRKRMEETGNDVVAHSKQTLEKRRKERTERHHRPTTEHASIATHFFLSRCSAGRKEARCPSSLIPLSSFKEKQTGPTQPQTLSFILRSFVLS